MPKIVISNIPDGASLPWITEQIHRMLGDDVVLEQVV